jgi:hypothetical protein
MHRGLVVLFLGWRGSRGRGSQNRKPVRGIEIFLLMNFNPDRGIESPDVGEQRVFSDELLPFH